MEYTRQPDNVSPNPAIVPDVVDGAPDLSVYDLVNTALMLALACVGVCGVMTNVINIAVFLRQGLTTSFTVSVFALSTIDLGVSMGSILWAVSNTQWASDFLLANDIDPTVTNATTAPPRYFFSLAGMLMTVYISFERCVCVTFPLKVKQMFTTTKVYVIVCVILIITLAVVMCEILGVKFVHYFDTFSNRTILTIKYIEEDEFLWVIQASIVFVLSIFSTIFIAACSVLLIRSLKEADRKANTMKAVSLGEKDTTTAESRSNKSRRLVKMVMMISIVSTCCNVPMCGLNIANIEYEQFDYLGEHAHLYILGWCIAAIAVQINSTINLFIFWANSSTYRVTFANIFGRSSNKPSEDNSPINIT